MTSNPRPATVGRYSSQRHLCVVREHQASYETEDGGQEPDVGAGSPFGLPVLAEVPELAGPLEAFAQADRLMVQMVLGLARLLETDRDITVEATGVGIEHWLALTATAPRLERRTWLRAARLLLRLPGLRGQVEAGLVSAGQLRALTIALRGAPGATDDAMDGWLTDAAAELHRLQADPDALVEQARQALVELSDHTEVVESDANQARHLRLQPRLDGSGGTFSGEEDAYGFAILEAATRPRPDQTEIDDCRARADNLQALLHGIHPSACSCQGADRGCGCPHGSEDPDLDTRQTSGTGETGTGTPDVDHGTLADPDQTVHRSWAHAIADAQEAEAAYREQLANLPGLAERIAGYADAGGPAPPKLLLRAELSTLIEHGRIPATLLTTLAGGQLRVTSQAARALVDAHGADLRLTIHDQGQVVGVGRATRRPPGWLRDALHAIHDHCAGPLCDRAAHGADIDHAAAWHPVGDQPAGGTTDLDNLGPLCVHPNRNRPATGWQPRQQDTTGVRRWAHARSGLATTSIPATWRPPTRRDGPAGPRGADPPDDPAGGTFEA